VSVRFNSNTARLAATAGALPTPTNFSFSCWVYNRGAPPANWGNILALFAGNPSGLVEWQVIDDGAQRFDVTGYDGNWDSSDVGSYTDAEWYFVAGYCQGTGAADIWMGVSPADDSGFTYTGTARGASFTPTSYLIGGDSLYDEGLNGNIGYFRAWNDTLTTAELLAEKAASSPVITTNLRNDCPFTDDATDNEINTWTANGTVTYEALEPPVSAPAITGAVTEAATAAETFLGLQRLVGSLTESASAGFDYAAVLPTPITGAVTEAATAADTFLGLRGFSGALTESASAGFSHVGAGHYGMAMTAAATAGDTRLKRADLLAAIPAAATPAETIAAILKRAESVLESSTASDQTSALIAALGAYSAGASADEAWTAQLSGISQLLASAAPTEQVTAAIQKLGALVAAASAAETWTSSLGISGLLTEAATAAETWTPSNWAYIRVQYDEPSPAQNDLDRTEVTIEVEEIAGDDVIHTNAATSSSGGGHIDVTYQVPLGTLTAGTVNVTVYAYDTSNNQSTVASDSQYINIGMNVGLIENATASADAMFAVAALGVDYAAAASPAEAYAATIQKLAVLLSAATTTDTITGVLTLSGGTTEAATALAAFISRVDRLGVVTEPSTAAAAFIAAIDGLSVLVSSASAQDGYLASGAVVANVIDAASAQEVVGALAATLAAMSSSVSAGSLFAAQTVTGFSDAVTEAAASAAVLSALRGLTAGVSESASLAATFALAGQFVDSILDAASAIAFFNAAAQLQSTLTEAASAGAVYDYRGGVGFLIAAVSIVSALSARIEVNEDD
jgi:hypothetical protein